MAEISSQIRPTLMKMDIGNTAVFPIEKIKSVRVQACELGAIMARRYSTRMDRSNRTVTVTRNE